MTQLAESFDSRLRLRRLHFPRIRPRSGPYGFLDGLGWLSRGYVWIDGWLTLEPLERLEVQFQVRNETRRRDAHCLVRPSKSDAPQAVHRHWILLVPVEEELVTASRIRDFALSTEAGELLWHGGQDRFISPEIGHRLNQPYFHPSLLSDLESFVEGAIGTACEDLDDPTLRRNLEALHRARGRHRRLVDGTHVGGEMKDPKVQSAVPTPDDPEVSILLVALEAPTLLNDQFLYLGRGRLARPAELIVVLGSSDQSARISREIGVLSDLYGLPARVVIVDGASWPAAVRRGAEEARGEVLVVVHGHTLTLDPGSLEGMVEPLFTDPDIGVTAPRVLYFDGMPRSAGYRIETPKDEGALVVQPIDPQSVAEGPTGRAIDACGSDCFAVRKHLIKALDAFSGRFLLPDFEVLDLCVGAADAGYQVTLVDASVLRMVESGADTPSTLGRGIVGRYDRCLLTRRRASDRRFRPFGEVHRISVAIPTYEPGEEFAEVLDAILQQECEVPFEVLIIDSGSRDGTRELLESRNVRYVVVEKEQFNHGLTRNLGVQHAGGDVVAFLSQDALPEPGWLAGLLAAFDDQTVAGAYSRQVPRNEASVWTRAQLAQWPASGAEPRRQALPPWDVFDADSLEGKLKTVCFDNVSSAVRRPVALDIPFRELSFGEDRDWAYRVMAAGYSIRYCPACTVIHSHDRSLWYELRRTVADHRSIQELLLPDRPTAFGRILASAGAELSRLLDLASQAPSRGARIAARLQVPARALLGPTAAHLAVRSVRMGASGSRFWRWIGSRLTGGV